MAQQTLIPHRSNRPTLLHPLLHTLLRPDGPPHFCGAEGRIVVHPLRLGQDLPIRRAFDPRRGRDYEIKAEIQEKLIEKKDELRAFIPKEMRDERIMKYKRNKKQI